MVVPSETQEQRAGALGMVFVTSLLSTPFLGWFLFGLIFLYAIFGIFVRYSNRIVDIVVLLAFALALYAGLVACFTLGGEIRWWLAFVALWPLNYLFLRFTRRLQN